MIPTYNEEKRMPLKKDFDFLPRHADVMLCFVNDDSTDNTKLILQNTELSALKTQIRMAHFATEQWLSL
jgi:hypothetical protein